MQNRIILLDTLKIQMTWTMRIKQPTSDTIDKTSTSVRSTMALLNCFWDVWPDFCLISSSTLPFSCSYALSNNSALWSD